MLAKHLTFFKTKFWLLLPNTIFKNKLKKPQFYTTLFKTTASSKCIQPKKKKTFKMHKFKKLNQTQRNNLSWANPNIVIPLPGPFYKTQFQVG